MKGLVATSVKYLCTCKIVSESRYSCFMVDLKYVLILHRALKDLLLVAFVAGIFKINFINSTTCLSKNLSAAVIY